MNAKLIVFGALAYFVTSFVASFGTGMVIHEGILDPAYRANESYFRPELRQDPPDMAALMPRWITNGLIGALVIAGIYGCVRGSFNGAGWRKGAMFGICLGFIQAAIILGWSGIFALPATIWIWWAIDGLILFTIGGTALGAVAQKVAPE